MKWFLAICACALVVPSGLPQQQPRHHPKSEWCDKDCPPAPPSADADQPRQWTDKNLVRNNQNKSDDLEIPDQEPDHSAELFKAAFDLAGKLGEGQQLIQKQQDSIMQLEADTNKYRAETERIFAQAEADRVPIEKQDAETRWFMAQADAKHLKTADKHDAVRAYFTEPLIGLLGARLARVEIRQSQGPVSQTTGPVSQTANQTATQTQTQTNAPTMTINTPVTVNTPKTPAPPPPPPPSKPPGCSANSRADWCNVKP